MLKFSPLDVDTNERKNDKTALKATKQIHQILYNFLWDGRTEWIKIKRSVMLNESIQRWWIKSVRCQILQLPFESQMVTEIP